jgi:integrase
MPLVKHVYRLKDGTQKKSKNWYFRFMFEGEPKYGSTGTPNRVQAEQVEKKEYDALFKTKTLGLTDSITLGKAIKNYLASVKDSGEYNNKVTYTNKLLGFKTNNRSKDREQVTIFGFGDDRQFETIKDKHVAHLVLARKDEKNKSGTILGELSVLSQIIDVNRQLGVPTPIIDFKEIKRLNNLKPSTGKLRYLSEREEEALLAQLHPDKVMNGFGGEPIETTREQRQDIYDFVVCSLDLGTRHTELAKLTWDDVDLKHRKVGIYRFKVKNQYVATMTTRMFEVLSRRWANNEDNSKHVFTAKDGGPRKYSSRAFDNACRRADIDDCGFHTLRHTFGSRLAQRGASLQEIQQALGHTHITTTMIYAHLIPNQAADKIAKLLEQ